MAETIATTTSVFGHQVLTRISHKDVSCKRRANSSHVVFTTNFTGQQLVVIRKARTLTRQVPMTVRGLAAELTKEAYSPRDNKSIPRDWRYAVDAEVNTKRWLPPHNKADDPGLHNPLLRQERMGCGWLGVIFEWEGVIVEDDSRLEKQAWLALSDEEGKSPPPAFVLKRIEGMKNEQAISEILCWSRDPSEIRRLASRKRQIYKSLHGGFCQLRSGSEEFLSTLANHKIPVAVATTKPREIIEEAIEAVGLEGSFNAIVAAEDVYRGKPDPEMFIYATQQLNMIPERCILFGNSNSSVEAAHDARIKCVAVASKHPLYELSAADLVIRRLSELTIVDLKNLAAIESPEFGSEEPEVEMEEEEHYPSISIATDDSFW